MLSLTPEQLAEVRAILITHIPDRDVYAFGSRVEGNEGKHSDLDLAIEGSVSLDLRVRARLREAFEESSLPFRVDLIELCAVDASFRRLVEERKVLIAGRLAAQPAAVSVL